ncbi:MAG: alpha/beta fold hydrolase, partial [Anaerolineae bacterium]|nr:alpha/beta fold hydrolase [Anaerolineae bacterium]
MMGGARYALAGQGARRLGLCVVGLLLVGLLLAGCGTPEPTRIPYPTPLRTVAASPTVDPVLPTANPFGQHGVNEPTAAAAPNDMDVEAFAPLPAESGITVVASSDGTHLHGMIYPAAQEPAPGILLVHELGGRWQDWEPLMTPLQQAGFTVLAMDLRGHGGTGGTVDWELSRQDVLDMLAALRAFQGVDASRVGVAGAGIGANLVLIGCAASSFCSTAVLLSPGLDIQGVTSEAAIALMDDRPVLLVASRDEPAAGTAA